MGKINKKVLIFVVFRIFTILLGLFVKTSINMLMQANELQVSDLLIEFENGTTKSEVESILESYNMNVDYSMDYNSDVMRRRYYMKINKDNSTAIIKN